MKYLNIIALILALLAFIISCLNYNTEKIIVVDEDRSSFGIITGYVMSSNSVYSTMDTVYLPNGKQ